MDSNVTDESRRIDLELCAKYHIKRPTYSSEDLEDLKICVDEKLKEFPQWKESWVTEATLVRFLKAFLNVEDTLSAMEEYCNWRVEKDVDTIAELNIKLDEDLKLENEKGRDELFDGFFDRCGRPVMLVSVGKHDRNHGNYPSLFKYINYQLEQAMKFADQISPDQRINVIFNLENFGMRNMDFKYVKHFLNLLRYYYPERIAQCFIINYPWIFLGCWSIIKVWMNDVTKSKFIFGGKQELNDFMDMEKFPYDLFPQ